MPKSLLAKLKNIKWNREIITYISLILIPFLAYTFVFVLPKNPSFKKAKRDSSYIFVANGKDFNLQVGLKDGNHPQVDFQTDSGQITFNIKGLEFVELTVPERERRDTVSFRDVQNNIDLRYQTLENGIKEEIILNERGTRNTFWFDLDIEGAHIEPISEGFVDPVLYDENGDYLFHFVEPYAYDEVGNETEEVSIQLLEREDGFLVEVSISQDWLDDKEREYPVYIDPTIVHDTTGEFALGEFNRNEDVGSPEVQSYYQPLAADEHTVGLWHMDETGLDSCSGGEDLCDSSKYANHGVDGATSIVSGLIGNARSIGGAGSNIVVTDSPELNPSAITIEYWLNTTANNMQNIYKYDTSGTPWPGYSMVIDASGVIRCWIGAGAWVYGTSIVNDGEWHHIACTADDTTSRIYVDGVLETEINQTASLVHSVDLNIGWASNSILDELRISNIARTPEDIFESAKRSRYSVFTSPVLDLTTDVNSWNSLSWSESGVTTGDGEIVFDDTNLVAQWNFNETSGTTANNDAEGTSCGGTPANCDGTLTGFDSTASQDADPDSGWTADNRKWGTGALIFDGTDSYIDAGNSTAVQLSSDFTLEAWINTSYYGTTIQRITSKWKDDGVDERAYTLHIDANSNITFAFTNNGLSGGGGVTSTSEILPGRWYYVVGTKDNSGTKLYINGHLEEEDSATATVHNSTGNLYIGARSNSVVDGFFKGTIDSPKIYTRALSASEILSNFNSSNIQFQTRVGADTTPNDGSWDNWSPNTGETLVEAFETNINPSDVADLRLWLDADDISTITKDASDNVSQWNDKSGNAYHMTQATASKQPNYTTGVINGKPSIRFTASTSDTMTEATNFGTACTVIYVSKQTGSTNSRVLSGLANNWLLGYWSGNKRSAYFEGWVNNSTVPSDTNWHIFSATIGGAGINSNVYENGSLFVGNTTGVDCPNGLSLNGYLGTSEFSDADISEVIAYDRILSETELLKIETYLANKYALQLNTPIKTSFDSTNKTEGTYSRTADTGKASTIPSLVGAWNLDETNGDNTGFDIFDATSNNNDGEFEGTNIATTLTNGIRGNGREFNGTDDYISLPSSVSDDIVNNITIEAWVYSESHAEASTTRAIVTEAFTGDSNVEFELYLNGASHNLSAGFYNGSWYTVADSAAFPLNRWVHVATTYDGNYVRIYRDGVLVATSANFALSLPSGTNGWRIGRRHDNGAVSDMWQGKIDEVRISNVTLTPEEIAFVYTMGKDQEISFDIPTADLSAKSIYAVDIASSRTGSFLEATIGENNFANGLPDENTMGLWNFEEIGNNICDLGTNDVCDSSGNRNHGDETSSPPIVKGYRGLARESDGVNDYIKIPDSNSLDVTMNFTLSGWVKMGAKASGEGAIVSKGAWDAWKLYFVVNQTDDTLRFRTKQLTPNDLNTTETLQEGVWTHVAAVNDNGTKSIYINGRLSVTGTTTGTITADTNPVCLHGLANGAACSITTHNLEGALDEIRIDNVVRTATEIRQAYERGRRTHPITIDFGASLDSGNLIVNSSDYSFTIDATTRGLTEMGSHLFTGDKIIIKENIDGVEYIAHGTVTAITESTGVTTVASWDSGSTFPSSGYTANATIFKWQTEYIDLSHIRSDDDNAITDLTYRITNGNEGRDIWIDNMRSVSNYLTDPTGSTIASTTGKRYFQYRSIFSSVDPDVSASLTSLTLDYVDNNVPTTPVITSALLPSNIKLVDSTPAISFISTDDDLEDLTYQIQWDTDSDFLSATTKTSSTDAGFANTQDSADTDPFTYNQTISYTWQTALTNTTTYFYQVRAFDGAEYGSWSEIRSMTIDTGTDRNTWYQTHADQFNEGVAGANINIDDASNSVKVTTGTETLFSPKITYSDFENESRWRELAFTDIETTGSILYKIYYEIVGVPAAWEYKKPVTITYTGAAKTNYDVLLEVDTATLVTASKLQADCDDLRILDADDATNLEYWIEGGCNTTSTQVWVTVPDIPDGGKTIYMYYGNPTALNTEETWADNFTLPAETSCPSGWSRNTDLDGYIPRGATTYGATDAGSSSHAHSNVSCTSSSVSGTTSLTGSGVGIQGSHNHGTISASINSTSNIAPPYMETVFCEANELEYSTGLIGMSSSTTPTDWTSVSGVSAAYENRFPMGATSYGTTGGAATHTHSGSGPTAASSSSNSILRNPSPVEASGAKSPHSHVAGNSSTDGGSNIPEYSTLNYIKSVTETTIPEGGISIVETLPPMGWTRYSALDGKFPYGAATGGTTGGDTTSDHLATLTTGGPNDTSGFRSTGGSAAASTGHAHSCSATTDSVAIAPAYIDVVFAKKNDNTTDGVSSSLGSEVSNTVSGSEIVSDIALPGNSSGFGTSPVDLSSLDTASYPELYVEASLTYSGGSPELQDWEVTLNKTPNLPTQDSPTDGSRTADLTPTLRTTATDADGDWLRYKIDLCMNRSMTVSCQTFDQTSSQTGWSGQNVQSSTAYGSGIQASYTVQSALEPGTVYYWRSYATDPVEAAQWSSTQSDPYWFMTNSKPRSASSDMYEHYISRAASGTSSSVAGWTAITGTADTGTTASTNGWIDDTNLTTGDRYLIMAWGTHNTDNVADRSGLRVKHGVTPFTESATTEESDLTGGIHKTPYFWFTVWTAISGEDLEVEVYWANEGGTQARTEDISLMAINAEELIANGSLQYSIDTAGTSLTTSFVTTETLNITSSSTSQWLTMGYNQWDINTIDQEVRTLLDIDGVDQANSKLDGEDTNDTPLYGFGAVSELGVNPVVSIESSISSGSSSKLSEGLMALDLSAFEQVSFDTTDTPYDISVILNWEEVLSTDLITNISTSWMHLGGSLVDDNDSRTLTHLESEEVSITDAIGGWQAQTDNILFQNIFDLQTSYLGAKKIDYEALMINTALNKTQILHPWLIGISMEKYNTGTRRDVPTAGANNQSIIPALQITSIDPDDDKIRYKIKLCENSDMSTNCQTFDQTSSQTGWSGQDALAGTAYDSGSTATYTIQSALPYGTTHYWRSYAIDFNTENDWTFEQTTPYSFTTTQQPNAPTLLEVELQTNPTGVDDDTPEFSAVHGDPDGDSALFYQIEVNTTAAFDGTTMWDSTKTATNVANGNRSSLYIYAGSGLAFDGTTYYWRIKFWDSNDGESAWAVAQFSTAILESPAPCSLEEATDDSQITINWADKNLIEDSYEIERSVNGGSFTFLISKLADVITHIDSGVSQGNTYAYRIFAKKGGATSAYCTTSTLTLNIGSLQLEGLQLGGIKLD